MRIKGRKKKTGERKNVVIHLRVIFNIYQEVLLEEQRKKNKKTITSYVTIYSFCLGGKKDLVAAIPFRVYQPMKCFSGVDTPNKKSCGKCSVLNDV